jgi:hypothetical protein
VAGITGIALIGALLLLAAPGAQAGTLRVVADAPLAHLAAELAQATAAAEPAATAPAPPTRAAPSSFVETPSAPGTVPSSAPRRGAASAPPKGVSVPTSRRPKFDERR